MSIIPIGMDLLPRQLTFLMNCRRINNYGRGKICIRVLIGHRDVYDCADGLGITCLNFCRRSLLGVLCGAISFVVRLSILGSPSSCPGR